MRPGARDSMSIVESHSGSVGEVVTCGQRRFTDGRRDGPLESQAAIVAGSRGGGGAIILCQRRPNAHCQERQKVSDQPHDKRWSGVKRPVCGGSEVLDIYTAVYLSEEDHTMRSDAPDKPPDGSRP